MVSTTIFTTANTRCPFGVEAIRKFEVNCLKYYENFTGTDELSQNGSRASRR